MESEVKTRSTDDLVTAIMEANERMWKADNTGVYSTNPLLWPDPQGTNDFGAIEIRPKRWQLFTAPSVDGAFWRLVRHSAWHAAPALPNGESDRACKWDVVVEPDDDPQTVKAKLEQARALLLQALATGELDE